MANIADTLFDRSQTPQDPDFDAVLKIARDDDCRICFARKINDRTDFRPLFSLTPAELKDKPFLPAIIPYLMQDSYFTPNGFFTAYLSNFRRHRETGLPGPKRTANNLRFLFAHFADLDVGRSEKPHPYNLTTGQAIGAVIDANINGSIPAPSIFGISGRGVYVYWLLTGPNGPGLEAYPSNVLTWQKVNRELNSRLVHVGADMNVSADPTRLLGMPGALHTDAKRYVSYLPLIDQHNQPFTYTLDEIAKEMNVRMFEPQIRRIINRDVDPDLSRKRSAAGKHGAVHKARMRLEDVLKIQHDRRGFPQGKRRKSLYLTALFSRGSGHPPEDTFQTLEALARNCRPKYPSEKNDPPLTRILKDVYTGNDGFTRTHLASAVLAEFFDVTDKDCDDLKLQSILTPTVKADRDNQPNLRTAGLLYRRDVIQAHIQHHPQTRNDSFRKWERILDLYGIKATYQTIKNDFDALGYVRTPGTPGRPPKRSPSRKRIVKKFFR